jgi:hypothetical protein
VGVWGAHGCEHQDFFGSQTGVLIPRQINVNSPCAVACAGSSECLLEIQPVYRHVRFASNRNPPAHQATMGGLARLPDRGGPAQFEEIDLGTETNPREAPLEIA